MRVPRPFGTARSTSTRYSRSTGPRLVCRGPSDVHARDTVHGAKRASGVLERCTNGAYRCIVARRFPDGREYRPMRHGPQRSCRLLESGLTPHQSGKRTRCESGLDVAHVCLHRTCRRPARRQNSVGGEHVDRSSLHRRGGGLCRRGDRQCRARARLTPAHVTRAPTRPLEAVNAWRGGEPDRRPPQGAAQDGTTTSRVPRLR